MLDPFYNPTLLPNTLHQALEDAKEYNSPLATQLILDMSATYTPLRSYRVLRLIAGHILTLTQPTSGAYPSPAWFTDALDPRNTPLYTMRAEAASEEQIQFVLDTLLVRKFVTALIDIGEVKEADVNPVESGRPLYSPARAELFQNLSSGWVDSLDNRYLEHMPEKFQNMVGIDRLMLDFTSSMGHEVLLPILMPTDRLSFMHPNRAYQTTRDEHYHTAGIPLAWVWDPSMVDIRSMARWEQAHTVEQLQTYAAGYAPMQHTDLLTSARSMTFSLNYGTYDYRPPVWEYAIISTQAKTSPFVEEAAYHGSNPALKRSAQLLTDLQAARYSSRPAKIEKLSEQQWTGLDTPLIERAMGGSAEDAVKQNITTLRGVKPTGWFTAEELTPDLMDKWSRTCTDYGPFAALTSGLRYVTQAVLSDRIRGLDPDSVEPPPSPAIQTPLPPPTRDKMLELEAYAGAKPENRPDGTRRHDVAKISRRGNPVSISQSGKGFFVDGMTQGDITTARTLVLPGAYAALRRLLTDIDEPPHSTDPVVKGWVESALQSYSEYNELQEFMLGEWVRADARHGHRTCTPAVERVVQHSLTRRNRGASMQDLIEALTRLANREMNARGGVYQHMRRTLAGETPVRGRPRKKK